MLVCTKKEVYKYLKKNKVKNLYLRTDFSDEDIEFLIKKINKDKEEMKVIYLNQEDLDDLMDEEQEGIIAEVPEKDIVILIILIISILLLFFIVFGLSFSLYDSTIKIDDGTNDGQDVGNIIFNYSDVNGNGNGINISNAHSISDVEGKNLTGTGKYFDFSVSGNTSNIPVKYYVLIDRESVSTLSNESVKIYLTKITGTLESELTSSIFKLSELEEKTVEGEKYKVIYSKSLDKNTSDFIDSYRLRLWVSNDSEDYYNKTLSVKVHIYAEGVDE